MTMGVELNSSRELSEGESDREPLVGTVRRLE